MGDTDIMGIPPYEWLVLCIVKNPGILTQHSFYQCPDAEPFNLPADVSEAVEFCFLYGNQVDHVVERIKILYNLPHT